MVQARHILGIVVLLAAAATGHLAVISPATGAGTGAGNGSAETAALPTTWATFDVPSAARPGTTVTVEAAATADQAFANTVTLTVTREDTGATVCTDTGDLPADLSCTGQFTMPETDVRVTAVVTLNAGGELASRAATVTANSAPTTTATTTPTGNRTGTTQALVDALVRGVTDGFSTVMDNWLQKLLSAVADAVFGTFFELLTTLLKALVRIVAWTPDVHGNAPVEEIHQRTLTVAIAFSTLAVMYAGIAYMTGGTGMGLSPGQARRLLPRILVGITFAVLSLPLLQYSVDATQALTTALSPDFSQSSMREFAASSSAIGIAIIIDAAAILVVLVAFLIRDVYLLLIASISPLIAIAWSLPFARRYASGLIAGWWSALAMAPATGVVFRFAFALARGSGGDTPIADIANWLLGLAAFTLILLLPFQLYRAASRGVAQAHRVARSAGQSQFVKQVIAKTLVNAQDRIDANNPHSPETMTVETKYYQHPDGTWRESQPRPPSDYPDSFEEAMDNYVNRNQERDR